MVASVSSQSRPTARFLLMTAAAAGIAVLGLIQNSVAVIIGAMLVAPLMGPIMGLGFGIAVGDAAFIRRAAFTLGAGIALSLAIAALIVWASPLDQVTSEIAARTQPTLLDLMVALFSAVAGAYATVRGQQGTIIGVAIATALMPPLAVVAFGLATQRWEVAGGAALLFATNFVTIALVTTLVARLYGFRSSDTPAARWQGLGIVATFVLLATPLGFGLARIAWTERAQAEADSAIRSAFGARSRISDLRVADDGEGVRVTGTVFTVRAQGTDVSAVERRLEEAWDRPVTVELNQYRVRDAAAIERAEADFAQADTQTTPTDGAERARAALAAVAGVAPDQVLVDATSRRAEARAVPIAEAGLGTYRALEQRAAAQAGEGWTLRLIPPRAPLPPLPPAADEAFAESAALIAWATDRTGAAVAVGSNTLAEALRGAGARVVVDGATPARRPRWVEAPTPAPDASAEKAPPQVAATPPDGA